MSGASSLFDAGVPEKIIQGRTGHRSLDALCLYEHVTDKQNQQVHVSKILSGQSKSFEGDSTAVDNTTSFAMPVKAPAAQYNHCIINISNSNPSHMNYFPYPPPPMSYYHPPGYYPSPTDDSSTGM